MRPLAALLIVGLAASPRVARAADDDPWWGRDKALHFGVSGALAAGLYGVGATFLDAPWERAAFGGGLAVGAGAAKELWDLTGAGDPSWRDVTWNLIGVATGLVLAVAVDLLVRALAGTTGAHGGGSASPDPA